MMPLGKKHERPNRSAVGEDGDPHATPIGSGADAGKDFDVSPLQSSEAARIGGPHGHQTPGQTGGPAGISTKENADTITRSRRETRDME